MLQTKKSASLIDRLPTIRGKYLENVPLKKHTWLGVGGPAEVMFIPEDTEDLSIFMAGRPRDVPVCIIGGGSNLLVRDGGISGVVIKLDSPFFRQFQIGENTIRCNGGVHNTELQKVFVAENIGGLEFLCSIPGTIGGSVKTNAGCFGKCIGDVLLSATIIDADGQIREVSADRLHLSYRHSDFPDDWIVTALTFRIQKADAPEIRRILDEHKAYRLAHQPYHARTAGSTFKNPEGYRAWELIKNSGCAELAVGGAKVSEKHCNFLINTGQATAEDFERLGDEIVRKVREKTAVTLEWEVKKMGVRQ